MVEVIFWISIISGGLLIVLMLLSLIGGLDLDLDISEADGEGVGVIKSVLTFVSVSTWMFRVMIVANKGTLLSLTVGILSGCLAVYLLLSLLKYLIGQEEFNTWRIEDALFSEAAVYLKVPSENSGNGIVNVTINGTQKEFKAISNDKNDLPTGSTAYVSGIQGNLLIVSAKQSKLH